METSSTPSEPSPSGSSFRPSYEGWKLGGGIVVMIGRIELLDLPMRDGNIVGPPRASGVPIPFRPSYEGWKPVRVFIAEVGRISF